MNKQFKNIVNYIQKYANTPPSPPSDYTASSRPIPSATKNISSIPSRNLNIVRMQEALQALAQDVITHLNPQKLEQGTAPEKQEAMGRDSFGDFFAKHYLRNADVPSVEFTPDPSKTKMSDKDPRMANKLNWVMDTMKRIGGEKSEKFADGVWGPRTNASLINSYALAEGLLNFAKEFKLPIDAYSTSELAKLKPAIREENDLTSQEKNDVAPIVTNHLKAIRRLYNEVKKGILEKPQWRAYIENDKPYIQYKSQDLSSNQINALTQSYPQGFSIPINDKGNMAQISINDLANINTLNRWLSSFPTAKLDPYNVLTLVSNQISKGG